MVNWWGVFYNSLWVLGLAGGLAALSMASYRARVRGMRLGEVLKGAGFQLPFHVSMVSFCVGLLFAGRWWWEKALWGLLAFLFAGQAMRLWRERRGGLETPAGASRRAPGQGRFSGWLGRGLIIAGLLVLVLGILVTGVQVLSHGRSLQSHLRELEPLARGDIASLEAGDLEAVGQHLAGMHADLEAIKVRVGPLLPAGRLLRGVPNYGGDLAAASDLLQVALMASAAGDHTFQALSPAVDLLAGPHAGGGTTASMTERLVPILVTAQPDLEAARRELAAAQAARARVDVQRLSPRVASLMERLDGYLPWFQAVLDGAMLAPDLLGSGEPRTYLILAQNNYELRATGGFITGVGEVRMEGGRLASLSFSDSYAVDNLAVPHELTPPDFQSTLFGQLWFFRDTNWNADYPTSARRALAVYANDRGVQADGAIALDLTALKLLVDAVAPLRVAGVAEPVTGENVLSVIQQEWDESYADEGTEYQDWWQHRKDFMGEIAQAAVAKVASGEGWQPLKLARALKQALEEKHLLVYVTDAASAGLLHERNWDGSLAVPAGSPDTLMVVDSNVGFDKMDASVGRSIHYQVDLGAEEGPRGLVTLSYENLSARPVGACIQASRYGDAYTDMMERCYWDYVRVYVPADSELTAGPDQPLPPGSLLAQSGTAVPDPPLRAELEESGRAVWTTFFVLEPLGKRTLSFDYRLPPAVLEGQENGEVRYRLQVQKQPGTKAVPLEVVVLLPPGAEVVQANVEGTLSVEGRSLTVSTDLRTDRTFEFVYREGGAQ
jgi:hypothetical protein